MRDALRSAASALNQKSTLTDADVQSAALIITALAPYVQNDSAARDCVTTLLSQLALNQNSDGSFRNSCAATSWVVTALSALKIDPVANDDLPYDVYAGLLTFQNGDGGFGSAQSSASSSPTTSVARIALVAYQVYQNGGVFFYLSAVTHHDPAKVLPPKRNQTLLLRTVLRRQNDRTAPRRRVQTAPLLPIARAVPLRAAIPRPPGIWPE